MNKHVTTEPKEAAQQFQIDEIERRAGELEQRWMHRVVWELDTIEPGELRASTDELLEQARTVLDVLARVHDGVRRARLAG
ncbi:MAG: hypothetical protein WC273_07625 [Dehalococcoidia bacterium]